jgi:hypothetical protein
MSGQNDKFDKALAELEVRLPTLIAERNKDKSPEEITVLCELTRDSLFALRLAVYAPGQPGLEAVKLVLHMAQVVK